MHRKFAALTIACVCLVPVLAGQAHAAGSLSNVGTTATRGKESGALVSVAILGGSGEGSADSRHVVRPFTIRLQEALLAGYSMHYELRLRNLSSACICVPEIEVLEARVLANNSPE